MTDQRYLVIDVETSALFDFKRPADAEGQGRLAQLAMIECEPAPDFKITAKLSFLVRPDGWSMSPAATEINGLTDEFLAENGVLVGDVLDIYADCIHDGRAIVAYGAQFDLKCMRSEYRRADRDDLFEQTPNICLMRALTGICRIPQKNGRGLKWPKLEEAMAFFDLPFHATHSAMNDALAAHQLLCKLNEIGELPEARVHHARGHHADAAE